MVYAIIVAAGKGIRMNNRIRKQYLLLEGYPVLAHTLLSVDASDLIDKIFLVVPEKDCNFCRQNILYPLDLKKKVQLVCGGEKRQDSVYNGLLQINPENDSIVVVHDGVRPFVSSKQIEACITGAQKYGACILGIPACDTLKTVNKSGWIGKTLARDMIRLAQTPQAFQYTLIKKAHENARKKGISGTDDAYLVEQLGEKIKMIPGSSYNIKITTKEDLEFAAKSLKQKNYYSRTTS